jgi:hypothetical protein
MITLMPVGSGRERRWHSIGACLTPDFPFDRGRIPPLSQDDLLVLERVTLRLSRDPMLEAVRFYVDFAVDFKAVGFPVAASVAGLMGPAVCPPGRIPNQPLKTRREVFAIVSCRSISCRDGSRRRFTEQRDGEPQKGDIVETADSAQIIKARSTAIAKKNPATRVLPSSRSQRPKFEVGEGAAAASRRDRRRADRHRLWRRAACSHFVLA